MLQLIFATANNWKHHYHHEYKW